MLGDSPSGGSSCLAYKRKTKPSNQPLGDEADRETSTDGRRGQLPVSVQPGGFCHYQVKNKV